MRLARAIGWLAATVVLTFQKWGFIPHDKPRLTVLEVPRVR